jgi:hypothetical protein
VSKLRTWFKSRFGKMGVRTAMCGKITRQSRWNLRPAARVSISTGASALPPTTRLIVGEVNRTFVYSVLVLASPVIMADKNKTEKNEKQIAPELREFIDRAIVPILVQEYLKEIRQHPASAPSDEKPGSTPNTGNP